MVDLWETVELKMYQFCICYFQLACVCVCVKTVILHVYQEKVVKAESSGTCFNSIY